MFDFKYANDFVQDITEDKEAETAAGNDFLMQHHNETIEDEHEPLNQQQTEPGNYDERIDSANEQT